MGKLINENEICIACGRTGEDNVTLDLKCYKCNILRKIKKKSIEDDDN